MKILNRLLDNCRESDRQMGMRLGVSGGAVRARIRKMQEGGIIKEFFVKVEPPVLGYGVLYLVVSGENVSEILKQSSLVGEPYFVVPCVGGVTVCGISIKANMDQKIELAKRLMSQVRILSIFEAENPGFSSNLTKTDLEILRELIKDPRQRIEQIARDTGMSTKTIARCIEKLHENDGIQFTLVYDPVKIKDFIPHAVLVWIDGDLRETLERLDGMFSESYMQIPFIAKNQIVLFMYSDNIFKMDELTQKVRSVKNIRSADLFIPKEILFYTRWVERAIASFTKSSRLHLTYQTD